MENTLSLTNKELIIDSTGTYIVEAFDACGLSDRDTIQVSLTSLPGGSCVRPGDVNGNGWVNMIDLLALGTAHGEKGPSRPDATEDWKDQSAPNWGREIPHGSSKGIDLKHADSDGNGEIDIHADAQSIFEHAQGSHVAGPSSSSERPSRLRIKPKRNRIQLGDTITYEVFLEGAEKGKGIVQNAYGVAFSMEHTLQFSQSPIIRTQDSWLGVEGQDLFSGFIKYPKHMDIGMTRFNQAPKSDSGKIAEIEITILAEDIDTTLNLRELYFGMKALNTVLMDKVGNALPINALNANTLETVSISLPWVKVDVKAILAGAFDPLTSEMRTTLKDEGLIPLISPYADTFVPEVGSIPEEVVDWISVQLRDKEDPTQVVNQRAVWLLKDGSILSPENDTVLSILASPGEYFLSIKHRNHLEAISSQPVKLDTLEPVLYDFTQEEHLYVLNPEEENPMYGLRPGDINQDGRIQYSGPENDRSEIFRLLGVENLETGLRGYFVEDLDLDGKVSYVGEGNDRAILLGMFGEDDLSQIIKIRYPK